MYLICTWCILLLFCCILFNSDVSHIYIVASWTTISFSSAAFLYTLCLWSVIFIYCIFWDLPNFYLQRGILSNSIPAWVSTYTLIMDANGWKYRVVTVGIRALVALGKTQHMEWMYLQNHFHSSLNLFLFDSIPLNFGTFPAVPKSIRVLHYSSSFDFGVFHNSTSNDLSSESAVTPISNWIEKKVKLSYN